MALPDTLASDAERERVAEKLRAATAEGRLTAEELGERLDVVYSARTHGELERALDGLPKQAARRRPAHAARRLGAEAASLAVPVVVCILVWFFTGTDGDFWPKWVILAVLIRLVYSGRTLLLPQAPTPPPAPQLPPDRSSD
jgi:hypothetical protein